VCVVDFAVMIVGAPPTEGEREEIRNKVIAEVDKKGGEIFSKVDLERLKNDAEYLKRFWLHAQLMEGSTMDNTVKLVVETFMWRKDFGVENIRKESISKGHLSTQ